MNDRKNLLYLKSILKGMERFCTICNRTISDLKILEYLDLTCSTEESELFASIHKEANGYALGATCEKENKLSDSLYLKSILQYICGNIPEETYYMKHTALSIDENSFPSVNKPQNCFDALWSDFCNEINCYQQQSITSFAETLLGTLFKYATNIPCGNENGSDVSLYDYVKTFSAISTCLYVPDKNEDAPFIIIGGDLSGIQSYIYQIVSKFASKNLKGRSYYVRLLSNVIVRYLLKQMHLYQANIIYNSGGSFYILAPNTQEIKDILAESINTISEKLFKSHGTSIYVAIDYVEVSNEVLQSPSKDANLSTIWKSLFDKRDKKKRCKFSSVITNDYDSFFEPFDNGGEFKHDSITGEEISSYDSKYSKQISGLNLKKSTYEQIKIGEALKNADFIVISEKEIAEWSSKVHVNPIDLGFTYYFLENRDINSFIGTCKLQDKELTLICLNDNDVDVKLHMSAGLGSIHTLEFYGGNSYDNKTFEDLCDPDGKFRRLGVLRMDVDNLGNIFQTGIDPEKATFARYAALSRSFDYFFSGYLNTLQREIAKEESLIIYSGGDDIFIVASWNKAIDLANKIQEQFRKFTCYNPAFSISGGISIHTPKYPIMKGAEESEVEEKNAKEHNVMGQDKNSISFMHTALNWDYEFKIVAELADTIRKYNESNNLPKSFISKIRTLAQMANIKQHKPTNYKSYWMLTYDLSRMKSETKDQDVKDMLNACIKECCGNREPTELNKKVINTKHHPLELWAFAARWAELESRTNN